MLYEATSFYVAQGDKDPSYIQYTHTSVLYVSVRKMILIKYIIFLDKVLLDGWLHTSYLSILVHHHIRDKIANKNIEHVEIVKISQKKGQNRRLWRL